MHVSSKNSTWKERFRIRAYEVGPRAQVTIQTICNYLQEAAGNHAQALNVSVDRLYKENLTWVLSRLHVQMNSYPRWQQHITVETWPSAVHKLYAVRDFRLHDSDGNEFGTATSSWMLINLTSRRPVSMPDYIRSLHDNTPGRAIDDAFDTLPDVEHADNTRHFNVRVSDLDMNQHVNNVNYIEWGLESVPEEIRTRFQLRHFEISFKAESRFGDRIQAGSRQQNDHDTVCFHHALYREADGKTLARMKSSWMSLKK